MRLTELEPGFYKYELRTEDITKVDPAFVWDQERGDYFNFFGKSWTEAGKPTLTLPGEREYLVPVGSVSEAHGVMFLCPKCFRDNDGAVGTHHIQMPFANRGLDAVRHEHQWNVSGSRFEDLTTTPSYLVIGSCGWHGYITNGEVSII